MRVEHEYDGETLPSVAIIQAIAAIEGVNPVDLPTKTGITLYDHVNPGALDQIATVNKDENEITVKLVIRNGDQYAVEVQNNGRIVVEKAFEVR